MFLPIIAWVLKNGIPKNHTSFFYQHKLCTMFFSYMFSSVHEIYVLLYSNPSCLVTLTRKVVLFLEDDKLIWMQTIESSPLGDKNKGESVHLSQLVSSSCI